MILIIYMCAIVKMCVINIIDVLTLNLAAVFVILRNARRTDVSVVNRLNMYCIISHLGVLSLNPLQHKI